MFWQSVGGDTSGDADQQAKWLEDKSEKPADPYRHFTFCE